MARACALMLVSAPSVLAHGYISTPTSRNILACGKVYDDSNWYADPFYTCSTDRETGAQSPSMSGLPAGVAAGDMPGVARVNAPFCSGGDDARIPDAIQGLNTKGSSQATWNAGDLVDVAWSVQAAHGGVYAYRLCCDGSDTEECFAKHILSNDDGVSWFPVPDPKDVPITRSDHQKVRVPQELSGECTLSWRWDGGCVKTACGPGQTSESSVFVSCADVTIKNDSPTPTPKPTPKPTPVPVPTPSPSTGGKCAYATCKDEEVCCCNSDKNIGYCVAKGSDPALCAGSKMCPGKEGCCNAMAGFLAHM